MVATTEPADVSLAGVSAIARCPTILEFFPSALAGAAYLKRVLPRYTNLSSSKGGSDNFHSDVETSGYQSREVVLDDAPLSRHEFHLAWTELCAFERDDNAMLPTACVLHALWKSIMSAATVKGINLNESLYISSIAEVVEDDGFPQGLLHAVFNRLSTDLIVPMEGCT